MFIDKFNKTKKFVETTLMERISESIREGVEEILDRCNDDITTRLILNEPAIIKVSFTYEHYNEVYINLMSSYSDESKRFSMDVSDIEKDIDSYRFMQSILDEKFINNVFDRAIMNKFSGANICRLSPLLNYEGLNGRFCVQYVLGTPEMSLADALFTNLTPKK
jgi:hypothetical protein